jgi:cytochrome b
MSTKRIRLWDLPTRLFHWLLVLCIVAAVVSGQLGGNLIEWHGRIGLFIVGLVVFRLVWGLIGSTYARFAQFFPTPAKLKAYLRGEWRGVGHNPLGAFSVFGLLALVGLQVSTGLFANDDITFFGPLFALVSKDVSNQLTGLHKLSSNFLFVLIGLHLAAIAFYTRVKKTNWSNLWCLAGKRPMKASLPRVVDSCRWWWRFALLQARFTPPAVRYCLRHHRQRRCPLYRHLAGSDAGFRVTGAGRPLDLPGTGGRLRCPPAGLQLGHGGLPSCLVKKDTKTYRQLNNRYRIKNNHCVLKVTNKHQLFELSY